MASPEAIRFHHLDRIRGVLPVNLDTQRTFALAFRFGQPFDFQQIARMTRVGVVNVYAMLDPIAFDCLYLNHVDLEVLWGNVFSCADAVTYISEFTAGQFHRRFRRHPRLRELVNYLSLDLRDYFSGRHASGGSYILVIGNAFAHKHVKPTIEALKQAFPREKVVALGWQHDGFHGLTAYGSGELSPAQVRNLLRGARCVVFPSHYEGFGLPVVESLAYHKPVLARDIPVMRELRDRLGAQQNVILYDSTRDLVSRLAAGLPVWIEHGVREDACEAGWDVAGQALGDLFVSLIESVSVTEVLLPRLEQLRILERYAALPPTPAPEPANADKAGLEAFDSQLDKARQELSGLTAQLKDRELQIADLRRSLSWRITAPLRGVGSLLLKRRGN